MCYSLSLAKQHRHHKSMRESNFDAINESIASTFENSKVVVEFGIVDETLDGRERHRS